MKFTAFNRDSVKDARHEIEVKLEELRKLGLGIKLGNITYNGSSFTSKIECVILNGNTSSRSEDITKKLYENAFNSSFEFITFGNAIGKSIMFMNKKYIFLGFKPGARKRRAIIQDCISGKNYRVDFNSIKSLL